MGNEQTKLSKDDIRGGTCTQEIQQPLVVAAIAFGTTFTGYGFSLARSPTHIRTGKYKNKLKADREPTKVLLKPDGSFDSFGCNAIQRYCDMTKDEQQQHRFFKTFKMEQHNTAHSVEDTKIKDVHNRDFSASKVFSFVIEYITSLVVTVMREDIVDLKENDMQWILSVPAIWSDSARTFMCQAAKSAGIPNTNLRIVLEPEAVSMYCLERLMIITKSESCDKLPVGYRSIFADLGGSTGDICAHEILKGGNLRELYRSTGKDLGGNKVDDEFYKFMTNLVGGPVYTAFQEKYMSLHLEFMKEFEAKKMTFNSDTKTVTLKVENALLEILKKETGETLEETIEQMTPRYLKKISFNTVDQRIEIKGEIMADFFNCAVDGIISKLNEILKECGDRKIETLFLVGGFAQSQYLRERLQSKIKGVKILPEEDATLAVLKGAVLMGYNQRNITERRALYTYGFSKIRPFKNGTDPEELRVKGRDGSFYCDGEFNKQIEKGQILKYGEKISSTTIELKKDVASKKNIIAIELWQSLHKNPKYCSDKEECTRIAEVVIQPPKGGWQDRIRIERHILIGATKLEVEIRNATTGEVYETKADY